MIRRHIEDSVRRAMIDTPVVLLNGARQTGKTTLAQAMATGAGAQYFTLDDSATLALAAGDPSGFIRNLTGPVVLDEIQKAPDLFPAIKLAVDKDRQPGRFLLTGSANVMTLPRLSAKGSVLARLHSPHFDRFSFACLQPLHCTTHVAPVPYTQPRPHPIPGYYRCRPHEPGQSWFPQIVLRQGLGFAHRHPQRGQSPLQ